MPETHVNAHKARVAELRQQAAVLNGEADQLQQYIDTLEPQEQSVPESEVVSDVVSESVEPKSKPITKMNRSELNAKATEVGIESPESLETNQDVIDAIKGVK